MSKSACLILNCLTEKKLCLFGIMRIAVQFEPPIEYMAAVGSARRTRMLPQTRQILPLERLKMSAGDISNDAEGDAGVVGNDSGVIPNDAGDMSPASFKCPRQ